MCLIAAFYVTHRKRKMEERMLAMPWKINYNDLVFAASGSKIVVNRNTPSGSVGTIMCNPDAHVQLYVKHVRDSRAANNTQ